MTGAADICAWLEDRPLAAPLYDLLAPFADVMTTQSGPVGRAVGRLAHTLGRRDEAEERLRAAVALCERMDAHAFLAMARYDLGLLLLPRAAGSSSRRAPPMRDSACRASPSGAAAYGIASAPDELHCSSRSESR